MIFHQIEFRKMPQPDKLFRDALQHVEKTAPVSAWDRIESGLDRPQPKWIWLKIAAGLLFLIALSFLLWPHDDTRISTTLQENQTILPEVEITTPIAAVTPAPKISTSPELNTVPIPKNKMASSSKPNYSNNQKVKTVEEVDNTDKGELNTNMNLAEPIEVIAYSEPVTEEESSAEENVAVPSTHANIFYTSAEVNARFMKKNISKEATPEKKPASGMKKVITIAMDLKNDDKIYGDLRQIKNELLTFNFPEKKREPTK